MAAPERDSRIFLRGRTLRAGGRTGVRWCTLAQPSHTCVDREKVCDFSIQILQTVVTVLNVAVTPRHPAAEVETTMSERSLRSLSLRLGAAGLGVATLVGLALAAPHAAPSASAATGGRGAAVPFTEYEAESAGTNGTVIGPSRAAGTLAGEASGRKAVTLSGNGRYVEFTLTAAANAVTLHYSVPDAGGGAAYTTPIGVYVNGAKSRDLTLTNKYSWYYGGYPFTNDPGAGNQHHMYD